MPSPLVSTTRSPWDQEFGGSITRLTPFTDIALSCSNQPLDRKKEFLDWFGNSHATNPDGSPAVVYRGEHGTPPEDQQFHSRLTSLSFCDDHAIASIYAMRPNFHNDVAQAPRVSPVHLKIERPIIDNREDPFINLAHIEKELGLEEAIRIAKKFSSDIEYTGNWDENYAGKYASVVVLLKRKPQELKKLYFDTFKYLDDPKEVALLRKKGYDGAIHVGNGETSTSTEYRVFDPSQVRSAIKAFTRDGAVGDGHIIRRSSRRRRQRSRAFDPFALTR